MGKRVAALLVAIALTLSVVPYFTGQAGAQPYRTISWGASGNDVAEAQRILSDWGYYDRAVDGVFGPYTSAAVTYFQSMNGLQVDGVVGPDTWAALGITVYTPAAAPADSIAPGHGVNIDLVARLIRAEAEAEPYEGKVAVAAVLLNRVNDSRFPNTLEGVIYEPDAFESVSNGRIYDTPATADDLQAARDAVNGWDPTYGCVFFWNPSTAVSPWIWSREIVTQIGSHVFAM